MSPGVAERLSILTSHRGEMCYCPGCSHAAVLEHLASAIDRIGLKRHEVCIVSDIGCIGTADKYFECHTFHGLHGRSLTYAEGIKRMRPEMTVIVLIGDGGCGIGTAHLVHAARRGIEIKVVVCNNFNFGMTGGQHSPTTPPGGMTVTTPDGAGEWPFDICRTVMANGAAHVGRYSALDGSCSDHLEALLRSPGFGLVDLWELCVAYYVPDNRLTPIALTKMSERFELPFGLLQNRSPRAREHATDSSANAPGTQNQARLVKEEAMVWPGRREISVAGSAGQRVRSAAGVIGEIAVSSGLFAAQVDDFPITVRKGHSISQLIIADAPILYTGVDEPELVILLSPEGASRMGRLDQLPAGACVVADRQLVLQSANARVCRIDFARVEKQVSKAGAALAVLTAGITATGWIDSLRLLEAARDSLRGKYRDENLRAMEIGVSLELFEDMPNASVTAT